MFMSQNALSLLYLVFTRVSQRRTSGMKLNRLILSCNWLTTASYKLLLIQLGSQESSMLKERLLNKISPDDACPLGVQLSLDTTGNIFQSGLKDYKHSDMVDIPLFTIDDDIPTSGLGSQANAGGQEFSDNLILLSVDDILGSNPSMMNRLKSRVASVRKPQASVTIEEHTTNSSDTQQVLPIRLSSHQITLLLSSIWVQSVYPLNTLENFEAIAHTYNLVLLVARNKNSSDDALIQSFQLAFSLRSISLNEKG
ncbi:uncharacterized protein LOC123924505 isoform X2 [Trifolium pratense]|nr:uncharacterized protein LOC123924505 isoform X2 [Trifolium pratense]